MVAAVAMTIIIQLLLKAKSKNKIISNILGNVFILPQSPQRSQKEDLINKIL